MAQGDPKDTNHGGQATNQSPAPIKLPSEGPKLSLNLTPQDIQDIVTAAIRAAKEPTPEEAAKAKADADRAEELRLMWKEEAEGWMAAKKEMQDNCDHKKPKGEDCFVGKLFSDGVYRIMCLRCQKFMREVQATQEMIQYVLQADNVGGTSWENFSKIGPNAHPAGQSASVVAGSTN